MDDAIGVRTIHEYQTSELAGVVWVAAEHFCVSQLLPDFCYVSSDTRSSSDQSIVIRAGSAPSFRWTQTSISSRTTTAIKSCSVHSSCFRTFDFRSLHIHLLRSRQSVAEVKWRATRWTESTRLHA